jgi:hypothetical protein
MAVGGQTAVVLWRDQFLEADEWALTAVDETLVLKMA